MQQPPTSLAIVDVIKALASQLIVWHHFIAYGPLARTVYPHAPGLFDWLYNDGRMAVQAFLVLGGFLAARSLAPRREQSTFAVSAPALAGLAWRRYLRLLRLYLVALLLAIVLAACARLLMPDPDTPAAPTLRQILFHVLLIHDIAGIDALTTGVWYVAIDFQLYCLLLLLLWAAQRLAPLCGMRVRTVGLSLTLGLIALSLLWINRNDAMEIWAVFYFGAYGLGVMLQWFSADKFKSPWLAALLLIYALALVLDWRTRLLVSLLTAALLGLGLIWGFRLRHRLDEITGWLGRISYPVFLIHYPLILLVGTIVARLWPANVPMALAGFMLAWLLTLGLATVLHRHVEARPIRVRR